LLRKSPLFLFGHDPLLLIALMIASPLAWWIFSSWLADFAYRISITADFFVIAFVIVLAISLLTLVFRIRAVANTDPVNAIRYE
jgi:putative ABC transport system permease protein